MMGHTHKKTIGWGKLARACTAAIAIAAALTLPLQATASSKKNPFESGFIPGATSTRATNPDVLAPKGLSKITPSGVSAQNARIAFQRIRGGLDFHQVKFNKLVREITKSNRVKVVALDQNPTHVIKGRIFSFKTGSGAIVSYRWTVLTPEGQKLQYFVDNERGTRIRIGTAWNGISEIELKKLSKTSADRLVYWLNAGA
ncbi:MAG: hypothetical protein AAFW47_02475 [Pseudomonadota bacterium]